MRAIIERGMFVLAIIFSVAVIFSLVHCSPVAANSIPAAAKAHRATLIRNAQYVWGIDAPIATFAAQVHQESAWNANARSKAGAEGIAQFMPGTSAWMAQVYPKSLNNPQPFNPTWALRAMVQYDRWIFERLPAITQCERWAMVLSAYNGGLGWVQRDRKLAFASGANQLVWFNSIERFNAGRSAANFKENRDYPRKILFQWEPLYVNAGWGHGVCK